MAVFFNDFGVIDFWRVKRSQLRFSRKFSLPNRYFCTTLLYQFFFDQAMFNTISPIPHNSLRIMAKLGKSGIRNFFVLMRMEYQFTHVISLKVFQPSNMWLRCCQNWFCWILSILIFLWWHFFFWSFCFFFMFINKRILK